MRLSGVTGPGPSEGLAPPVAPGPAQAARANTGSSAMKIFALTPTSSYASPGNKSLIGVNHERGAEERREEIEQRHGGE